jgi:hypothetical protein
MNLRILKKSQSQMEIRPFTGAFFAKKSKEDRQKNQKKEQ